MTAGRPTSKLRRHLLIGTAALLTVLVGCNRGGEEPKSPLSMQLRSTSVSGDMLGKDYTCDGRGISPQLSWSEPPPGTKKLALVLTDRDSPLGYNFVHWVLYNLPPSTRELAPGLPIRGELSDGSEQGPSDQGRLGIHLHVLMGNRFITMT